MLHAVEENIIREYVFILLTNYWKRKNKEGKNLNINFAFSKKKIVTFSSEMTTVTAPGEGIEKKKKIEMKKTFHIGLRHIGS